MDKVVCVHVCVCVCVCVGGGLVGGGVFLNEILNLEVPIYAGFYQALWFTSSVQKSNLDPVIAR